MDRDLDISLPTGVDPEALSSPLLQSAEKVAAAPGSAARVCDNSQPYPWSLTEMISSFLADHLCAGRHRLSRHLVPKGPEPAGEQPFRGEEVRAGGMGPQSSLLSKAGRRGTREEVRRGQDSWVGCLCPIHTHFLRTHS